MAALDEGSRIGAYRIVRKLGEGGMGEVFEAIHVAIGRQVAIKILHAHYAARQDVVGRFFNEARAANLIDHPGIVQVADVGYAEDGTAYIVMEFLRGVALSKKLRTAGLSCAQAVHITRAIASALTAAHDKNIVHRDLKPDNVMLIPDPERPGEERVKLLDFGIAKLMEGEQTGHVKTRTDMVMGTPSYMSPEQCRGANRVDAQSDVYSLGVMLYEMLAGRLPFVAGDSGSLIGMHLFHTAPPLLQVAPHVPEPVAALTDRLLSKDKHQRPSMRQLTALLQQLEDGGAPLPTGTGRTWLSSMWRTVLPRLAKSSTLGVSTGQAGGHAGSSAKRPMVLIASTVGLLAIGGAAYFIGPLRHSTGRQPVLTIAAPPIPGPAAPPSPVPSYVRWDIASDPSGAEVRAQDGVLLGKTPLVHKQPAQPGVVVLSLKLAGYQPTQVTMDRQTPGQVDKRLTPLPVRVANVPLKPKLKPASSIAGAAQPAPPKSVETRHDAPPHKADDLLEK